MAKNLKHNISPSNLRILVNKLEGNRRFSSTERDSQVAQDQAEAMRIYRSEWRDRRGGSYPKTNVNPGFQLSEIKDNSIAELMHWLDEEIIKAFYAQGRVVELEPRSPQTEEVAKKTSILAEDILFGKQNARWFRDFVDEGLLLRLGMARVDMVEERWEPVVFENKTVEDILQIMTMPDYRPKAGDKSFDISPQPDGLYSILAEQREPRRIVIRAIPVEQRLIPEYTATIDQSVPEGAEYIGERMRLTFSQLVEKLPSDVEQLKRLKGRLHHMDTGELDYSYDERTEERFSDEDTFGGGWQTGNSGTEAITSTEDETKYEFFEEYIRCDVTGNGMSLLYKVQRVGLEIIRIDRVPDNPYFAWTPFKSPHKLTGMSIVDMYSRWQAVIEASKRAEINAVALNVLPRTIVNDRAFASHTLEGEKAEQQWYHPHPHQLIRVDGNPSEVVMPFPIDPRAPEAARALSQLTRQRLEQSSGMTGTMTGNDHTAIGRAAETMQIAQQRAATPLDRFVRSIAEALPRAVKRIIHLYATQGDERDMRDEKGQWIKISPVEIDLAMECKINVAGSVTSRDTRLNHLWAFFNAQREIITNFGQTPYIKAEHLQSMLKEIAQFMDLPAASRFVGDPTPEEVAEFEEMQANKKDPEIEKAQINADVQVLIAEMKNQVDLTKISMEALTKQLQITTEAQMENTRIDVEEDLEKEKLKIDAKIADDKNKIERKKVSRPVAVGGEKTG